MAHHKADNFGYLLFCFISTKLRGLEPGRVAAFKKQCGTLFLAARA